MTDIEKIYAQYAKEVYRFAYWLSGDITEAEDIVSETFIRLWGSVDRLHVETLKAYLLTIAKNVFLNRRRSPQMLELPLEVYDRGPRPEERLEDEEEKGIQLEAVLRLPEGERAALLLRIQQGLAFEEIARVLGISLSAAKVRVHRARLKLIQDYQRGENPR